jgi:hypothetical protein
MLVKIDKKMALKIAKKEMLDSGKKIDSQYCEDYIDKLFGKQKAKFFKITRDDGRTISEREKHKLIKSLIDN